MTNTRKRAANGNGNEVNTGNDPNSEDEFLAAIKDMYAKYNAFQCDTVITTVKLGNLLLEAKKKFPKRFTEFKQQLPFGERKAEMLIAIAKNPVLSDPQHAAVLPPHWYTLWELCSIPDDELLSLIGQGKIHPDMTRSEAHGFKQRQRPQALHGLPRWKDVPKALATLLDFAHRFTPKELAPHVIDDGQGGWSQQRLEEMKTLAPFITKLATEMQRRCKERDAETEDAIAEIKVKRGQPAVQETHP